LEVIHIIFYICFNKDRNKHKKQIIMKNLTTTTTTLIRVRIFIKDFQGNTNRTEVRYVETLEEASKLGWKYELA